MHCENPFALPTALEHHDAPGQRPRLPLKASAQPSTFSPGIVFNVLTEVEVAVCVMAAAIIAFIIMVVYAAWRTMAFARPKQNWTRKILNHSRLEPVGNLLREPPGLTHFFRAGCLELQLEVFMLNPNSPSRRGEKITLNLIKDAAGNASIPVRIQASRMLAYHQQPGFTELILIGHQTIEVKETTEQIDRLVRGLPPAPVALPKLNFELVKFPPHPAFAPAPASAGIGK